jgi:hypothetical protein
MKVLKKFWLSNPSASVGLIVTVALAVQNAVAQSPDWKTALPLIVSLIIRQFVSPSAAVQDAKYAAFVAGLTHNPSVTVPPSAPGA